MIEDQQVNLEGVSVKWLKSLKSIPKSPTISIANEFFDALPINQFLFKNNTWFEKKVALNKNGGIGFDFFKTDQVELLKDPLVKKKDMFFEITRHSGWKKKSYIKAKEGLNKALSMLLSQAKIIDTDFSEITVGMWNKVRGMILANEGTLNSKCGKLSLCRVGFIVVGICQSKICILLLKIKVSSVVVLQQL